MLQGRLTAFCTGLFSGTENIIKAGFAKGSGRLPFLFAVFGLFSVYKHKHNEYKGLNPKVQPVAHRRWTGGLFLIFVALNFVPWH